MRRRSRQNLLYSHQTRVGCPCSEMVREEKENARKEKDRAAEIWKKKRRWERMREDVEFYLLENVWSCLRIPKSNFSKSRLEKVPVF